MNIYSYFNIQDCRLSSKRTGIFEIFLIFLRYAEKSSRERLRLRVFLGVGAVRACVRGVGVCVGVGGGIEVIADL